MPPGAPDTFSIVAIIAAFNEEDVIDQVVTDLITQGIAVYLIDDGSSDRTAAVVSRHLGRGLLKIERRSPSAVFDWTALLRRKEEIAGELAADWFMHQDADEFRESPWITLNVREALWECDRRGYNAVDFQVLNFRPTTADTPGPDVRASLRYYAPADSWDGRQVKAWHKQPTVDLTSSGGHEVRFAGRRVAPVHFLSRHYPIRSHAHGQRKVFTERLPRFSPDERRRGWHVQYEAFAEGEPMVWHPADLREFDPAGARIEVALERPGVGELMALSAAEQEIASLKARLESEQAKSAALLERARRRDLESEYLGRRIREAVTEAGHARSEVDALRQSKSWRITAPLRAAYRIAARLDAATEPAPPARLRPVSDIWGLDRGLPIDRFYIERFLRTNRADVHGRVLEVKDAGYTRMLDDGRVQRADVLDVSVANGNATLIADLSRADAIDGGRFDCFILTQTLHIIYDIRSALGHAIRILAPGGVLLCTIPAISRTNYEDGGLASGDYWRLTQAAVRRLFDEHLPPGSTAITTYGNVATCSAFLYGLSAEEMAPQDLEFNDPWFPLIHCVRAVKP